MWYNDINGDALEQTHMATSLEEYVAQATKAYQPASNAIQTQLDSLSGKLETANEAINKNYARQQDTLNRNRNAAAEAASLQAAGSGGSFGGAANIANRKYYENSFVPAVTQLQTNQANDLAQAKQSNENERTNLNSQMSNLQAQVNQGALAQYYKDIAEEQQRAFQDVQQQKQREYEAAQAELARKFQAEQAELERQFQAEQAEKSRQAQIAASRASQSAQDSYYRYLMEAMKNGSSDGGGMKTWDFGNGYKVYDDGGEAVYSLNGNEITRGQFLEGTSGNTQWNLWNDIWNSGTKTNGVGSDTIQAYSNFYKASAPKLSGNTASLKNSNIYGYLY